MKHILPLMHIPKFSHHYKHVHKAHVVKAHHVGGAVAQLKNGDGIKKGTLKFKM